MSEEITKEEVQEQETVVEQTIYEASKVGTPLPREESAPKEDKKEAEKDEELPLEEKIQVCYYCQFFAKNQKCSLTNGEPKFLGKKCGNFVENPKAKKNMWTSIIVRSIMAVLVLIWGIQDIKEGIPALSNYVDGTGLGASPFMMIWGFILVICGITLLVGAYKGYKLNKNK